MNECFCNLRMQTKVYKSLMTQGIKKILFNVYRSLRIIFIFEDSINIVLHKKYLLEFTYPSLMRFQKIFSISKSYSFAVSRTVNVILKHRHRIYHERNYEISRRQDLTKLSYELFTKLNNSI